MMHKLDQAGDVFRVTGGGFATPRDCIDGHLGAVGLSLTLRSPPAFCFVTGIVLVFVKYPFIGMIVETFGFLNLFG